MPNIMSACQTNDRTPPLVPHAFLVQPLFVVVTIFGVWLGWQLKIVRERKAILRELEQLGQLPSDNNAPDTLFSYVGLESQEATNPVAVSKYLPEGRDHLRISWVRRLLDDETCVEIIFSADLDPQVIERAEIAFPEAHLEAFSRYDDAKYGLRDSLYAPPAKRQPNIGTIFKTGLIEK